MIRYLPFILYILLVAYCLTDALQHRDHEPYGLPKWAWVIIILLFPYIGAAAWIILKVTRSKGEGNSRNTRPIAPDDDPQYLSWLREQERRRKQQGGRD